MKEKIIDALLTKKMKILLSLLDCPLRFTDIKAKTKFSTSTLSNCLKEMKKLEMIRLHFDETKSHKEGLKYSLTRTGQKLAELGKKITEEIQTLS